MTTEIIVPIEDRMNPPALKFPKRCVACGKPQETTMKLGLNMGVQKRSYTVMMNVVVPMCTTCANKERSIVIVTVVPFFMAFLITFVAVFIPVWLIAPEGTSTQSLGLDITIGAFAGIIAGIIGGSLVEFVLKLLLVPIYGRLLLRRPLTVFSVFDDSEAVVGLSLKFCDHKKSLRLIFENDGSAHGFAGLNSHEKI